MNRILLSTILFISLIFSSTESPIITIIGKHRIYVTGTITKYESRQIILDSKKGKIGGNITIDGSETDSTTKAELLNLLHEIFPEGI